MYFHAKRQLNEEEEENMAAHRVACLGLNVLYSTVSAPKQVIQFFSYLLGVF